MKMVTVRRYSKRSGVIPSGGDIWVRLVGNTAGSKVKIMSGEKHNEDDELGYDVWLVDQGQMSFLTEDEILSYYGREEERDESVYGTCEACLRYARLGEPHNRPIGAGLKMCYGLC